MRLEIGCTRPDLYDLYVHFHDWNNGGRTGQINFEGRCYELGPHAGEGTWVKLDVMREDALDQKLLLEAQLRHMLASIFREMGLHDRAATIAYSGIERVEGVLKIHAKTALARLIVEEAFEARWNLFLDMGAVPQAIETCQALLELFPDSLLADKAFMSIGKAYYMAEEAEAWPKALSILRMVVDMPDAPSAPEAAYLIGAVWDKQAGVASGQEKDSLRSSAIQSYMHCAATFPDSAFAADALRNVVKYYYDQKDLPRVLELVERICQDYQDQEWLHKMILAWGVVSMRLNQREVGIEKLEQVIEEYPESTSATTAAGVLRKMGLME